MLEILTKSVLKYPFIVFLLVHFLQVTSFKTDVAVSNKLLNNFIIPFSKVDGIGYMATAVNKFFEIFQKPAAVADYCKPRLVKIGIFQLYASWRPFGECPHCCKITNINEHINLIYFTRKTKEKSTKLPLIRETGNLRSIGFDSNCETIIYIHGFTESGFGPHATKVGRAYLKREELYNIILVDWKSLCPFPWYSISIQNTKLVANKLAEFIEFYHSTGEMPISKIHLIGFSLGAHIAGMVGKILGKLQKLPRITAIDPALPLYYKEDNNSKVSKFDAEFMDVIHTDSGKLGYVHSVGHADFYPNGGSYPQPGCSLTDLLDKKTIELFGTCDHFRGVELYTESVLHPESFPATYFDTENKSIQKNNFIVDTYMGFLANKSSTFGDYYLITSHRKPFGKSALEQEMALSNNEL